MAKELTVSLPDKVAEQAEQAVRAGHAVSVSAYIAAAIAQSARADTISAMLADMRHEYQAPTKEDYQWARQVLGLQ